MNHKVDRSLTLIPFQEAPFQLLQGVFQRWQTTGSNRGALVVLPAGCGKTFIAAKALRSAQDQGILEAHKKPYAFCNILYLTTAKAIKQTNRVLLRAGVRDFIVTSHMSMAKSFGDGMLQWITTLRGNAMVERPIWDEDLRPSVIILDESQAVKNENALLSEIVESAIAQGIIVIMMSATPFTKPSETTITNLALRLISSRDANCNFMSTFYVQGGGYDDYTPGTMAAYRNYLESRGLYITAEHIKFPHRVFNKCVLVDFETPEHRRIYERAYEDYLKELAEAGRCEPADERVKIWVANQKFWQKSELIRVGLLASTGVKILTTTKKQIIIAVNYNDSLDLLLEILKTVHKIPEDKISIIRGGIDCQKDIDDLQLGRTDFCLLTLKAGGAGLSLHHEHKCARPRYCIIPPTYSAIQLVQLLGRAHRINSLSATYQDCVWFRGTIEEEIAEKVQIKMRSLKEVVSRRETWLDLFMKKSKAELKEIEDQLNKDAIEALSTEDADGNMFLAAMPLEALEDKESSIDYGTNK